jgi:hypothetical protein
LAAGFGESFGDAFAFKTDGGCRQSPHRGTPLHANS